MAAPTGSGKTLAAFLASIDSLFRQAVDNTLPDETQVVYISPLKALSNDIHRNLQVPLEEIRTAALAAGLAPQSIRVAVRTGDTPQSERQAMVRKAPHILVTTPESLYLVLTSPKAREILRNVRTVIVDEIHVLARDKRGLASSLVTRTTRRIMRQAANSNRTLRNAKANRRSREISRRDGQCRRRRPAETAGSSIRATCANWILQSKSRQANCPPCAPWKRGKKFTARLSELINKHRSTLVFVNTRRMAERVTHYLEEQLGEGQVASHHGSLSRETRLKAEEQLKNGQLKAIVATASLELGIDIGYIDLVCQIGSPRSIATFLQRVGRAGHALGHVPKGRLFALYSRRTARIVGACARSATRSARPD